MKGNMKGWSDLRVLMLVCIAVWVGLGSPANGQKRADGRIIGYALNVSLGDPDSAPGGGMHTRTMSGRAMFMADNELIGGLQEWDGMAVYDPDMDYEAHGTSRITVGSWDFTDPKNPTFTPSPDGGVWIGTWHGTGSFTDGSSHVMLSGSGISGSVEGMRFQAEGVGTLSETQYLERLTDARGDN